MLQNLSVLEQQPFNTAFTIKIQLQGTTADMKTYEALSGILGDTLQVPERSSDDPLFQPMNCLTPTMIESQPKECRKLC